MSLRYLMVLTAGGRRLDERRFAMESAFIEHIRTLKAELGPRFGEIVIAMAELSSADYENGRASTTIVDERTEGIRFVPLFTWHSSNVQFAREAPSAFTKLVREVKGADFIHSHSTQDLWRPVEAWAIILAKMMNKTVISITDIDGRRDAEMNYQLGRWGRRTYAVCKSLYDPIRDLEQKAIVEVCNLVLFKEPQQVEDYGKRRPHVRLFLDPNFLPEHIIPESLPSKRARHSPTKSAARLADPQELPRRKAQRPRGHSWRVGPCSPAVVGSPSVAAANLDDVLEPYALEERAGSSRTWS